MKLEVGKYYKRGDGAKVYCGVKRTDLNPDMYYCWEETNRYVSGYLENGLSYTSASYLPLIEEWKEPKSYTHEIYLYEQDGILGLTFYNKLHGATMLGKKTVTIIEGEGM